MLFNKDILTNAQYKITRINELKKNSDITKRKADKSNTFIIPDIKVYLKKIKEMLEDKSKVTNINSDLTEDIKIRLNGLITKINKKTYMQKTNRSIFSKVYLW